MNLNRAEKIFSKIYTEIGILYDEKSVIERPPVNVIQLHIDVGNRVTDKLEGRFVPSFFHCDLYEKRSLLGRVSACLFSLAQTLHLNRVFACFDPTSKLVSTVLKAERCWLGYLLDRYEKAGLPPQDPQKVAFVAQHLAHVVKNRNELALAYPIIQNRLNELVALTNVFYKVHGLSHAEVTGRLPQTYFRAIFSPENDPANFLVHA